MITKKTELEILDEFEAKYIKHPELRAKEERRCRYHICRNNNKCAVGQYFTEKALENFGDFGGGIKMLRRQMKDYNDLFLPEYRGHELDFWEELQDLHDISRYWKENDEGMTKIGLVRFNELRKNRLTTH